MQKTVTTVTQRSRELLPSHIFDVSEIQISAFSTWGPSLKMPINRMMQSKPYVTFCWRLRECLLQESDNDHSEKPTWLQEESKSPGSHPILYFSNNIFYKQLWTEDLKHSSCRSTSTNLVRVEGKIGKQQNIAQLKLTAKSSSLNLVVLFPW